ncbi:MAG: MurT ligase domain-containing protein [Acidimicrobiales bacterium]
MRPLATTDVPLRARLATAATLGTGTLSRRMRLGSGSVIGGRVGLAIDPALLAHARGGRDVVLVTGTNGKTTTTRMIVAALGGPDAVATNAVGSNLPPGLAAALVSAPGGERAVLEVDEGYVAVAADALAPRVMALLNLSRDQLDRVSEVRMVAARLRGVFAAHPDALVVANADDPLAVWAVGDAPRVCWVGAGQLWHSDAAGCPACDGPVVFDERAGWSSTCGLCRPFPDYELVGEQLRLPDGSTMALDLALPGRFNRANAAVALAVAASFGVDPHVASEAVASVSDVEGRFSLVDHGGVRARLLLAKNPAGFAELLGLLSDDDRPVVIGINAKVADGHDPSWLWDVGFERLAGRFVVATGQRAADLAVRLRYAGVAHARVPEQTLALSSTGADHVDYIGNYTAFQDLRRALRSRPPRSVEIPVRPTRAVPPPRPATAPKLSALRVVVVHPDLLGTYGDTGNGMVLAARALWRDLDVELVLASSSDPLPVSGDLYCLGGGEDGPEVLAARRLGDGALTRAVEAGAAVLAVCAGYQVAGASFPDASGIARPGLGLLDVVSVRGQGRRAVGELAADPLDDAIAPLTGFENHGGVTRLGPGVQPLALLRHGVGNGDGTEGAMCGNVVGTYLHGPVLARNPSLADWLLGRVVGATPAPLDDEEEDQLRAERFAPHATRFWRRAKVRRM